MSKSNCVIIGIDLAWGSKNPKNYSILKQKRDGVCVALYKNGEYSIVDFLYPKGNEELIKIIQTHTKNFNRSIILIDAPIVCTNPTGARPVDRLTHKLFYNEHATCYPANSINCSRPIKIANILKQNRFKIGWDIIKNKHLLIEVYPHPAMVRLFKLKRIFKYKKGAIQTKQIEFKKYQSSLKTFLAKYLPNIKLNKGAEVLLKARWNKKNEDLLDAFFCTIIGIWHHRFLGKKTEIIGDTKTGFILLPIDLRKAN